MRISLCNAAGETLCGTDGRIHIDGRIRRVERVRVAVVEYRDRFVNHFPEKAEFWTHFKLTWESDDNRVHLI